MFAIHDEEGLHPVEEIRMAMNYHTLIPNYKIMVLTQHMEPNMITQHANPPFKTVFFKPESRKTKSPPTHNSRIQE